MTTPKNETLSAEALASQIFNSLFGGVPTPSATAHAKAKESTPVVDHVGEFGRLLKKAETAASESDPSKAGALIQIADRHFRMIELAVGSQK